MPNYPGTVPVVLAWLDTLTLPADGVGADLPTSPSDWSANGFVQVPVVAGGSPGVYTPVRSPVVQIDCWTNRPNSELPPWRRCEHLAESVVAAMYAVTRPVTINLGEDWHPARLHSIYPISELRRVLDDPAHYARVTFDVQAHWTVIDDA